MSRGSFWLAAMAGATLVGAGAIIAVGATSETEPRPTPPRVYSSCLAAMVHRPPSRGFLHSF
ncbi:hypothetical protein E2651_01035 [Streptomyces sp. MZ04]|nr:hypothetical protein E2651_01035 [Streptomyces sp. MZ04]